MTVEEARERVLRPEMREMLQRLERQLPALLEHLEPRPGQGGGNGAAAAAVAQEEPAETGQGSAAYVG